jgi:hypothetical protein
VKNIKSGGTWSMGTWSPREGKWGLEVGRGVPHEEGPNRLN